MDEVERLKQISNIPLTDADLEHTIGVKPEDIILYKNLAKYETIDELLPNNTDFKIILLEWKPNAGHWVVLYKLNNNYCYFNSYGNKYDNDLNVLSRCMRRILGEDTNQITRLLGGKSCEWSKKRFQKGDAQTCGRWCVMRVSMLKMGFDQKAFDKYLETAKYNLDLPYDLIVCKYIPIGNHAPM
jgi:hypothetical protein